MDEATQTDILRTKDLVTQAKDVLILTHANPTADSIGSALALYVAMKNAGKHVVIGCPTPMIVEFSSFVGANKVETKFSKKNFVISLDYEDGSIDKVTYNIEGQKFNLIIEPRPGFENFNEEHVSFHHKGTAADVIFIIDTMHLGELGELYEGEKELFATRPIINIDKHIENAKYGAVNIIDHAATTAELVATVMSEIGTPLTEDIATNLLNAIYSASNNFQEITARTFEVAGACVKAGGKRFPTELPLAPEFIKELSHPVTEEKSQEVTAPQPAAAADQPLAEVETPAPTEVVTAPESEEKKASTSPVGGLTTPQNPPEDWLKPKIFKSSSIA
ncbi:MAG: DHH family phosphoesterase [Microgenomates group bacterium]